MLAGIKIVFVFLLVAAASAQAGIVITAARVWPAVDYTRVTLESASPVKYQFLAVKNPDRLVIDLEGVDVNAALEGLAAKVAANDPYIKLVRVARNKPGVVRVVLDMKGEVKPQMFTLPPYGEYGHRLVLDIYPLQPADPLMALLEKKEVAVPGGGAKEQAEKPSELAVATTLESLATEKPVELAKPAEKPVRTEMRAWKPEVSRLITIAIDAGHGGEDPGALGKNGSREKDVTLAIARRLKAQVDAEPNMRGVLIRDGDFFIPLHGRVIKARNVKADLFV
ncbi:MAG: AMIN domain-containing protein, partial [Sulfuricella sp.]|nr:AMIN domain-containing protein [Sulfuricella sp.]